MVRTKLMEDGPILHFVASIGAVRLLHLFTVYSMS